MSMGKISVTERCTGSFPPVLGFWLGAGGTLSLCRRDLQTRAGGHVPSLTPHARQVDTRFPTRGGDCDKADQRGSAVFFSRGRGAKGSFSRTRHSTPPCSRGEGRNTSSPELQEANQCQPRDPPARTRHARADGAGWFWRTLFLSLPRPPPL